MIKRPAIQRGRAWCGPAAARWRFVPPPFQQEGGENPTARPAPLRIRKNNGGCTNSQWETANRGQESSSLPSTRLSN